MLEHRWSGNVLTEILDRTLIKLTTRGLVARPPAKSKKVGARRALDSRGPADRPGVPEGEPASRQAQTDMGRLKKSLLLARSLGLPAAWPGSLQGPGFKAAVLRQKFGLPLGDYPDLKSVKAELTRKLLGMGPKEKITLETVQAAIFGRELGEDRPADPKKVLDRLVSRQVGARRDDENEIRDAVLRGWISGAVDAQPDRQPAASPSDLAGFARKVQGRRRRCASGRFGDNKVFIIHVWRALQNDPEFRDGPGRVQAAPRRGQ